MHKVGIADLKARLTEHLRAVPNGRRLMAFDRDTLVAACPSATVSRPFHYHPDAA
jgi:hypothetical protein